MRILISVDMEGASGIVTFRETGYPRSTEIRILIEPPLVSQLSACTLHPIMPCDTSGAQLATVHDSIQGHSQDQNHALSESLVVGRDS